MEMMRGAVILSIFIITLFAISHFINSNQTKGVNQVRPKQLSKRRGFECDRIDFIGQSIDSNDQMPKKIKSNQASSNWPKDCSLNCKKLLSQWTQFRENHKQLDKERVSEPLKKGLMAFHGFDVTSYDQTGEHLRAMIRSKGGQEIKEYFDIRFFEHQFDELIMFDAMDARLLKDGIITVMIEEQGFGQQENEKNWFELIDLKSMLWIQKHATLSELWIGLGDRQSQRTNKIWKLKFEKKEFRHWIDAIKLLAAK